MGSRPLHSSAGELRYTVVLHPTCANPPPYRRSHTRDSIFRGAPDTKRTGFRVQSCEFLRLESEDEERGMKNDERRTKNKSIRINYYKTIMAWVSWSKDQSVWPRSKI